MPAPAISSSEKLYFRIGEVARLAGLETYVLRFWETEFPMLKPVKSSSGQRLYRRKDVDMVLEIKRLVHQQGFTLAGARKQLRNGKRERQPELGFTRGVNSTQLHGVRRELQDILQLLRRKL